MTAGRAASLHRALGALKPRWAWVALVLGLPWLVVSLPAQPSALGCLWALSGLAFWLGAAVLGFLGFRWAWRKLLFRVSRRLWVILLLLAFLPTVTLTVALLSMGWLGLGAQVGRTFQGNLRRMEAAVKEASTLPGEAQVLKALAVLGEARVHHVAQVPEGMAEGFLGYVYDWTPQGRRAVALRLVQKEGAGWRLINLGLGRMSAAGRELWGGRMSYRLDWAGAEGASATFGRGRKIPLAWSGETRGVEALASYQDGEVPKGTGLLRAFRLPPVALRVVDWESGKPMVLTATPETSLVELFRGFGFGEKGGNLSGDTLLAIALLSAGILLLMSLQLVALIAGLTLAFQLGRSVDGLFLGVGRLSTGDFSTRIPLRGRDQIAHLTRAFNEMAARLQAAGEEHEERLRMEEELRVAREVQMRLLPDLEGLRLPSVRATILPAREVAGDYYDVFPLPDGRLAFLIADVSGKGTSAAFYAAETKGVISALDKAVLDPVEVADRLNTLWCEGHGRNLFLTLVYGTFHPHTGEYRFVRAGHPPAYLRRGDGTVLRLQPRGLGIGLTRDRFRTALVCAEGVLAEGERLLFFTDGLSEALDPEDALYGEARIEAVMAQPGVDLPAALLADVVAFTQGRPLADDLTLLLLTR